jgi:uncharacterized alpha-E superfamily protein
MLSRVADSIYWMSRNIERAENLSRFVDVTLHLIIDLPHIAEQQWQPLVMATGDHLYFYEHYGRTSQENVVKFLLFDRNYGNSIATCVQLAREGARSVRETIASEMWEHLNQFYYFVGDAANDPTVLSSPQDFLHEVKMASHLFKGIADSTMNHSEGWHFLQLGRMLERADKTSRILDVKYFSLLRQGVHAGTPTDDLQWTAVLRSVSGFEMYRKRFHALRPERIVQFLTLDPYFPRSIRHCVDESFLSLQAITGGPSPLMRNVAEERLGALQQELAAAQVGDIIAQGLHPFVDQLQNRLNEVGEGIFQTFIAKRADETLMAEA